MPIQFIPVNESASNAHREKAVKLKRFISLLREVRDVGEEVKAVMDNQTDATDWAPLATMFGLPTGQGETTYNLVAAAYARVNHADIEQLVSRVG